MAEVKGKAESDDLNALLQDAKTGLWGYDKLRKKYPKIPAWRLKEALKKQEYVQRHKPVDKEGQTMPGGGLPGTYQSDIIFEKEELKRLNANLFKIVTLINVNTRYASARAVKTKGEAVDAIQEM